MQTGLRMTNIGEYLTVFVINAAKEEMYVTEMPNTLKSMKNLVGANCIEIGDITILDQPFKIIFPAKADRKMRTSCADPDGKTVYRGNVVVVGSIRDTYGNETLCSLTEMDTSLLMANTGLMCVEGEDCAAYNTYVLCNVVVADDE